MSMAHPDDRMLERYRSHRLKRDEAAQVDRHMAQCLSCKHKLEQLEAFDRRMASLPLEELSPGFSDRVTGLIESMEKDGQMGEPNASKKPEAKVQPGGSRWNHPEFAHLFVAATATYLFVGTGVVGSLIKADAGAIEFGLYTKMLVVMDWVDRLLLLNH